jgi:murein DD-endopeptidase MepM/ murein hydrolase activator NlpD
MMQKNVRRLRRFLLLAGISLCSLVVLEVGQEMVKALDLASISTATNVPVTSIPATDRPIAGQSQQNLAPHPQVSPRQNLALDFGNRPAARPQSSAVNTGTGNDPQQPIAQAMPQVATNTWTGSSFPVENFQAYTSPFGYRQSPDGGYTQEFHYGLDMASPEGSYVRNWWGGTVVEVSDDSNCGTSVVIESGPWTHIYCHMEGHVEATGGKRYMIDREGGIQIMQGQKVPAGARIGRVGMSGRTTGPHLHWGLKYNKNWVDPALVLRAMYSNQRTALQPNGDRVQ